MSLGLETDQNGTLDGVSKVAFQALSTILPAQNDAPQQHKPLESYLRLMFDAVLSADRDTLLAVVKEMRRARISSACIAEIYVPCVARRLGDGWVADTLDFGAVTIGSARLQSLLWRLEKDWSVPVQRVANNASAFLIGLPEGNQHTLGATVLAGQLRHLGMLAHLDLELTPQSLKDYVTHQQLAGVLLSAAACDDLAGLRELVDTSHEISRNTPVIIGGGILEHSPDILDLTHADFATNSVHDMLWYCEAAHLSDAEAAVAAVGGA